MLGFGVGISHCGIRGGVSDAPDFSGSAAKALLAGESQGLAFDFTDSSAYIIDTGTPANNYDSTGIVSNGSLVGPSGTLTYTSPSNKLTLQSDGFLRYQAHNLYLNSAAPANQSITVVSGASYAVTITGTVSVTASGAATGTWTAGTNTFTAATTTLTLGSTSGSGTVHVRRTPSNDDYIETAGAAKYALPLEYDTSGNCLGLLVEEARTNVCAENAILTTASGYWSSVVINSTNTLVSDQAPFAHGGIYNLVPDTSTATHRHYRASTELVITVGNTATLSCYVKANGYNKVFLRESQANGAGCGFNLSTGEALTPYSVANMTASNPTITSVGNSWYRISITLTAVGGSRNVSFGLHVADDSYTSGDIITATFAGNDSDGVLWALPQTEAGSFPTSPVITYGAAATRNADNISIATSAFPFSSTAGSLLGYATSYNATSALSNSDAPTITMLSNGSSTDRIGIRRINATNGVNGLVVSGGSVQQNATTGTWANAASKKASQAWQSDDAQIVFDGTAGTQDTSVTLPTITTLFVGSAYDGMRGHWGGIIKAISYVPRRKTDAELQAETA